MRLTASGATIAGPRHLARGEANQDALFLRGRRGGWICAVSDGVGSCRLGGLGARSACQAAGRVLSGAPEEIDFDEILFRIHQEWRAALGAADPAEAAATLLFARATAQGRVQAAQLGDGLLLARFGGAVSAVAPERQGRLGETWALEERHRRLQWSFAEGRLSAPGDGVLLTTDGVADDLRPGHEAGLMDTLRREARRRSRRRLKIWLRKALEDWATPMHGDDKTLAVIFRSFA